MARIDNLTNFLTDVATSIRTKKGTTDKIAPKDFDTEIESIQSGGGTPNLQEKSVTITENTTTEIVADSDYDGLSKVSVTTNIPTSSEMFTITNCTYLFQNNYRNDVIDKLLPFCNGTTDTSYMFSSCSKLSTLNLSNFDTSSVINMSYMFNMCSNLTSLDLSSFNTQKVTNMSCMFQTCSKLSTLNLSNFDTSSVINMRSMFSSCNNLTSLDLSSFNTQKVTDASYMFNSCSKLSTLNLSSFNTQKVTNMSCMFQNCSKLSTLNLSNFDTSSVINMFYMFNMCSNLTSLDLSSFDFTKVTSYSNMFGSSASTGVPDNCEIIVKDDAAKTWITSKFSRLTNVKTVAEL